MVLNRQRRVPLAVAPLEEFLSRVKATLDLPQEVSVCFVSDAVMARMNAAYRKKTGPTDVLSFPAGTPARARYSSMRPASAAKAAISAHRGNSRIAYLGDIAIAPQTARRNARRAGRALALELQILILHGILHLLGYDHERDHGEMHRLERELRRRLALE